MKTCQINSYSQLLRAVFERNKKAKLVLMSSQNIQNPFFLSCLITSCTFPASTFPQQQLRLRQQQAAVLPQHSIFVFPLLRPQKQFFIVYRIGKGFALKIEVENEYLNPLHLHCMRFLYSCYLKPLQVFVKSNVSKSMGECIMKKKVVQSLIFNTNKG